MERPDRPGILSRIRMSIIGAAATSLVASLATMPFALHHFDRAALFSVLANIASTPVITLWTTPAAALAALAAPFGLDEPFLWLMGKSMEVVLVIARYSVELSPEFDLPRLGATGMAFAAAAIALFCVFSRRGRIFAIPPAIAAVAFWIAAPQAVGYVADDGSVFLQQEKAWLELTDWRSDNGLNPLIIGDVIEKASCPGKGAACWLNVDAGQAIIEQVSQPAGDSCPTASRLTIHPSVTPSLTVDPCAAAGRGGAAIDSAGGVLTMRFAQMQSGRAWTQPLYAKPLKRPASKDQ